VSRYRDNIETFSFNVTGGYLIVEFNKTVKRGARRCHTDDLSLFDGNIDTAEIGMERNPNETVLLVLKRPRTLEGNCSLDICLVIEYIVVLLSLIESKSQ
jgi:hypothetical protein